MGISSPRPRPLEGVPLGRGRHRRHLRPASVTLLRHRALERPRSDPEGAAVRPDRQRGQPRRGRQGVLLLPGFHAHSLVHEIPLQVPAGGVPLRATGGGEPQPRSHRRRSSSCSIPASSTKTATSMSSWSTPRRARGHLHPDQRRAIGVRTRPRSNCCRRSGSATPGRGTTARKKPLPAEGDRRRGRVRADAYLGRRKLFCEGARPNCCSRKTRPTTERLYGAPNAPPT